MYDLTAGCTPCQWANVANALLIANSKDFLIWRGNQFYPTAVWKYNSTATQYTIFADELFDNDTETAMPLDGLNTDEDFTIISEQPLDKVNVVAGDLNATAVKLLGFYWTGAWIAFTDTDGLQSDGSLLIDDMSDLTNWADEDAVNGVSTQDVFQGRQVMKLLSGAAAGGSLAQRNQDMGTFAAGVSLTVRAYCDLIGTRGDGDGFKITIEDGSNNCIIHFGSDGMEIYDGGSYNEVQTDIVVQDTWQEWTFVVAADFSTVSVYLAGVLVEADVDCSYAVGGTDGHVTVTQGGTTTSNQLTYIDIMRVGDGDTETGDNFADGTELSLATLGKSGAITWTARTDEVQTDIQGIPGFAYKFMPADVLDNPTSITGISVHAPMATVRSVWDGFHEFVGG
jgi:hypothetical protein